MVRSKTVLLALLLTACHDPYSTEPASPGPVGRVPTSASDDGHELEGTDESGIASASGTTTTESSTGDPTWPGWPGDNTTTTGLPDDEIGTTWPAASMDGGDDPDTTTTGGEPTCTAGSCPVEELHGCTGDCDPCDEWAISWVPMPGVFVYLIRYSFATPLQNEGDDIFGVADGAFRVTAPPGEPSTFPWAEEDGRIVITCDRLTSGCPATYALLKVEVVGCVGDPQYPALAATCGSGVLLDGVEFPTGTCDPDLGTTSSTGG